MSATAIASAGSQTSAVRVPDASRAQLDAKLRAADSLGRREEAYLLRTRLRDGDFEVGDKIFVSYEGIGLTKNDTLLVQAGRVIQLGEPMGDLRVGGVLRFELPDSIRKRVSALFKNEVVHVTPLVRLSLAGAIRNPGVTHVRPDAPLGDVLMRAGQDPSADLTDIVIKRGETVVLSRADVQVALTDGLTVERLNLDPGDEIVVGRRRSIPWMTIIPITLSALTTVLLFVGKH